MSTLLDEDHLHRTAKLFMDTGQAQTHDQAIAMLQKFGLTVRVGTEITNSVNHQIALLTLVNIARRTFLGGIEVVGLGDSENLTTLTPNKLLRDAVVELGGILKARANSELPSAVIGTAELPAGTMPCWLLAWDGWRGGVVPSRTGHDITNTNAITLAPALAAAVCAAEAFSYHAADHPLAGRRSQGLSLWRPGADWLVPDPTEPSLSFLPSRMWIIGLGNLGQAFAWLLACLPYDDRSMVQIVLQDFDRIAASNESTSVLTFERDINRKKARVVAEWLDRQGFETIIEERHFGPSIRCAPDEPGLCLCGVDSAETRSFLDQSVFRLVVEVGLGAGPQSFRGIAMHTFPASRTAAEIWSKQVGASSESFESMPAYEAMKHDGIEDCGVARLASRTVGVPFVGLVAGCLAISEILRRLHGGWAAEVAAVSVATMGDVELVTYTAPVFEHGYVRARIV